MLPTKTKEQTIKINKNKLNCNSSYDSSTKNHHIQSIAFYNLWIRAR